ncbi:MAG: cysteine--tRNA ligase [Oscillospiraceae bacterium]|nr:cysteine--tRNA ligase [Oscillospiraceae bacterium]
MKIFNTLTRKKDELVPLTEGEYKIYVCGPTVYGFIHIGNARPLCTFDVLRRYLEYRGNKVIFVQNFTDIDDKLIKRAIEENATVPELAEKYIAEYKKDAAGLNVRPADFQPRATENVAQIIAMIRTLVGKGFAYEANGDVYFRAKKFAGYGKLSRQPMDELEAGARIDINEAKESAVDFALWKAAKPGEPSWASPWGRGRPGWHIECSVMSRRYLGDTIDIHCGGQDLIFPHHENEIAQSECANGAEFSRYFMHNGHINIDNKKMAKSDGNFFLVREVAEKYGYEPVRFLMVSSYYRSPVNFSEEVINQCGSALARLYTFRENLDFWIDGAAGKPESAGIRETADKRRQGFIDAMENDLNTADALAELFELVRELNTAVAESKQPGKAELEYAAEIFDELAGVLGLLYNRGEKPSGEDALIEELIARRGEARKSRDFKTADEIRARLKDMGVILEDTPQGVKWRRQ